MKDVVDSGNGAARQFRIGEVAFDELDVRQVLEVGALAGDQTVDDTNRRAAADEFFSKMRPDKTGAAGYEVRRHSAEVECKS